MKKFFFATVSVIFFSGLQAQFVQDYLKAADQYFAKGDYNSAAEYYDKYMGINKKDEGGQFNPYTPQDASRKKDKSATSRELALYRLGECYRLLNYPAKAAVYYRQIIESGIKDFPLVEFHYASQLRAMAKYAEAEQHFKTFLASYSNNDEFRKSAEREIKNLAFIQSQLSRKDLILFTVNKASSGINPTGANYALAWQNAGRAMFTSTRPVDSNAKNNIYTNRIFQADFAGGQFSNIIQTNIPHDAEMHQGVVSFSPDGNLMFLTKWASNGDNKTAAIYSSTNTAGGWSEPVKLDASVNAPGSSSQQPFVTKDGKFLFYSSNRSGGQGGFDIWYAPLNNGKPGASVNAGAVINTAYDEQAPYYHDASQTLVFSSNGRVGMGGFDFYKSKGAINAWAEPENLGYPVNSIKDDLYFTSRGPAKNILQDVMLSSDRDAACCLELFSLNKVIPVKQVSGLVVACETKQPISGATVSFINTADNSTVMVKTTGADGSYSITLDDYMPLKAVASYPGYVDASITFYAPGEADAVTLNNPAICLDEVFPPPVGTVEAIENIYFEFDKSDLKEESFPALDKLAEKLIKNPQAVLEISGHTDAKGSDEYNQKLSEARAQSCVKYLVSKGVNPEQLVAVGYGEKQPLAPNTRDDGSDNPEGREKNRRIEFKVLKDK